MLQTTAVFSNVSKGILAKKEDLLQAFGTDDEEKICLKILAEGELQVSDKERKLEFDTIFRDVASVLSEKCVNPETNRPYTISVLERALRDVHFSVDPRRPAKAQALEALTSLKERFPIERARMRLRIVVPLDIREELDELMSSYSATIEEQDLLGTNMILLSCLIDPGAFRKAHALVQSGGQGGRVEVISLAASGEDIDASTSIEQLSLNASSSTAVKPSDAQSEAETISRNHVSTSSSMRSIGRSGFVAAHSVADTLGSERTATFHPGRKEEDAYKVVYPRGSIAELTEEFASRRERFSELDKLESGWSVELRRRREDAPVDAVFYSPTGEKVGAFALARRMALEKMKEK